MDSIDTGRLRTIVRAARINMDATGGVGSLKRGKRSDIKKTSGFLIAILGFRRFD